MENFEKCAKRKRKKHFISLHCPMLSVVAFPPLFFNLSPSVILDILEVPASDGQPGAGTAGAGANFALLL